MTLSTAGQFNYDANRLRQRAGLRYNDQADRIFSYVNGAGASDQVITITPTAANEQTYTLTIAGISVSFLSDASATALEISQGLQAAIQADAILYGIVEPTISTNDLVLTVLQAGDTVEVTGSATGGGSLAIVAGSASEADRLAFGVGVVRDFNIARGVQVASSANLIARQVDLTPAAVNDAIYIVSVSVAGSTYDAQFTADGTATAAEIVDGLVAILNGLLPANTVVASNDSDNLRLLAEVAGQGFEFSAGSNNSGATWTVAADNDAPAADVLRGLIGVSILTDAVESQTVGESDANYPPGYNVGVLREGLICVEASGVSDSSESVYLGTASGEEGLFFPAAGTGRIDVSSRFEWHEPSLRGFAILYVR